jgi:ATP-binding cassette subfamily C protein CydCD
MTAATATYGLADLIPIASRRKGVLALTMLSGVIAQAATVISLGIGAWIVGQAAIGAAPGALTAPFWFLAASVPIAAAARWWQSYVSHDLAFALIEVLQVGVYDGLERAAPGRVLGRRTGDLASIATADAETMEFFYAHILGDYVGAVLVPLGALVALAVLNPLIALVLAPFLPLLASVPYWLARRAAIQGERLSAASAALNADVVEAIQGQRELAIFGQGRAWLERLAGRTRAVGREQHRYGVRSGLEQAAIDILLALAVLAAAGVGIMLVMRGDLTIASLPLVLVLAGATLAPITEVTQTARKLGELRAGANRVLTVIHHPPQVTDHGAAARPAAAAVQFEDVRFGYGGERGEVLRGLTFEVRAGQMVALVGRSGAGKSTCANLLMRFWDAESGHVRIGGVDVRDLPMRTLRQMVAMVPQDVHLFHESVADNIRLGRPEATLDEVRRAARIAQADSFIMNLPEGYDTQCGERGARLSGGERQRIAIARAVLCDAPILILDEAASNLDAENERALQAALAQVRQDRTVLVIAHRQSTIRAADWIVVLENGKEVEEGRHHQLVTWNDRFTRLIANPCAPG